jgi:hypothetical protein
MIYEGRLLYLRKRTDPIFQDGPMQQEQLLSPGRRHGDDTNSGHFPPFKRNTIQPSLLNILDEPRCMARTFSFLIIKNG